MIIAQKTYKHKVLLLMKVGLAVFMVVIFLAQNAQNGLYSAQNFAYKKLNDNEVKYFLNSLNALPEAESGVLGQTSDQSNLQGLDLESLSQHIANHIKTADEPLLLQEASVVSVSSPAFSTHQDAINVLMYSIILGIIALLFLERQKLIFSLNQSFRIKQILNRISPRSPNYL